MVGQNKNKLGWAWGSVHAETVKLQRLLKLGQMKYLWEPWYNTVHCSAGQPCSASSAPANLYLDSLHLIIFKLTLQHVDGDRMSIEQGLEAATS